LLLQVKEEE